MEPRPEREPQRAPEPDYQPQPQRQPEAASFEGSHGPGRAYAPRPNLDCGGGAPEAPQKAEGKGGRTFQNILAVVILGGVIFGGGYFYMANRSVDSSSSSQPSSSQTQDQEKEQGTFSVSVDGQTYGTFSTYQSSLVLNTFLKIGDSVTVTCVSLPPSSTGITVRIGTNIRVYESDKLQAGQQQTWSVRHGFAGDETGHTASHDAVNWFSQQAEQGNPVAEYGMGNMSYFGIDGIARDNQQSVTWLQRAASQNYGDAAERVALMQRNEQQQQQNSPP